MPADPRHPLGVGAAATTAPAAPAGAVEQVIRYTLAVRRAILARFEARSCIETVRAGARVAAHFGHHLRPVPARVGFFTPQAWANPDGQHGYSVGVLGNGDADPDADRWWDGHLVGILDGAWLCDLSAGQFSRPDHGLDLPVAIVYPATGPELDAGLTFTSSRQHVICTYQRIPDRTWCTLPAWTSNRRAQRDAVAAAIVALTDPTDPRRDPLPDAGQPSPPARL